MQTMYDLVWLEAERAPENVAIVDDRTDRALSYRSLIAEVDVVAAGLAARGVAAGTRVATCMPNLFEHCITALALQRLGAVPAIINPRLKPEDAASLVAAGGLQGAVILANDDLAVSIGGALPEGAALLAVGGAPGGAEDFGECRGDPASLPSIPRPEPEDPCIIFYTSGTTGLPKGVVLSHRTTEHRILWLSTQAGLRHGPHNRSLGFMPLAHAIGFHGVFLVTLAYGGTYHVMSAFDPAAAVDAVEHHEISYIFAAPTLYFAMVNAPNYRPDRMRSLELCLFGGASIDPKLLDHMGNSWGRAMFIHIYGTTETMCSGYNPDPMGDSAALRPGFYTRLRYIELGGGPEDLIGPGEEGELIVDATAATVFSEYLNRPDATAEKKRDGWYFTGDVISVDDRGYFSLRGRVDDMMRTGGESVHPEPVEAVLREHAGVADCSVVGIVDSRWGQMVVGCVVRAGDVSSEELEAHCRSSRLAGFQRPRAYVYVDAIPRNPGNGNILRRLLREQAAAARERDEGFEVVGE